MPRRGARIGSVAQAIPIVDGGRTMMDALRIFRDRRIEVIGIGSTNSLVILDEVVRNLGRRVRLHDFLQATVATFGESCKVLRLRSGRRAILNSLYRSSSKYHMLKKTRRQVGAITPRSLFTYLSGNLRPSDLGYRLRGNSLLHVSPNMSIAGLMRRMSNTKSLYAALSYKGYFKGVVSAFGVLDALLRPYTLRKIAEGDDGYFYESTVSNLARELDSRVDHGLADLRTITKKLSTYGNLAVTSGRYLRMFVDDYTLLDFSRKVLLRRFLTNV